MTLTVPGTAHAQLSMPSIFGDHMVLQRNQPVVVWGEARPGAGVLVSLDDRIAETNADREGTWRVSLPSMPAGGPHDLTVRTSSGEELVLTDVLVGEVWICSGQSNMEWQIQQSDGGRELLEGELDDQIRYFHVPRRASDAPIDDIESAWATPDPERLRSFSGVGHAMAVRLRDELGVPVGLIQNAYGGAPAEAWVPIRELESDTMLEPIVGAMREKEAAYERALGAWERAARLAEERGEPRPARPSQPFGDGGGYKPGVLWHAMTEPLAPFRVAGVAWYQGESNVDAPEQYATLLRTMMEVWRAEFEQPDLPFAIVQLSSFSDPAPWTRGWPELREVQADIARSDPNAGLVVSALS